VDISFTKMHGAGNDFIVVDDRDGTFPEADRAWIAGICARNTGVGAEGVILVRRSDTGDAAMRFLNPDGRSAEFCGNGARCAARFVSRMSNGKSAIRLETDSGLLNAEAGEDVVWIDMPRPSGLRLNENLAAGDGMLTCHRVTVGVPHAVIVVDDLAGVDVAGTGRSVRMHAAFAPAGTNVDFIAPSGRSSLSIRTYERGVEAETGACGSGAVAACLAAARLGLIELPATARTRLGYELSVAAEAAGDSFDRVRLGGTAEYVFAGTVRYGKEFPR